jgi:hypothetical protein
MVKKKLDKLQEAYDGLVQSDEGLQVLLNDLMSRASDRERIAITFDRQKDGLSLIEIIFTKSKLISITNTKPTFHQPPRLWPTKSSNKKS